MSLDTPNSKSSQELDQEKQGVPFYDEHAFVKQLAERHQRGKVYEYFFMVSNVVALLALGALFLHVINQTFGYVVIRNQTDPVTLASQPLDELSVDGLVDILQDEDNFGRNRMLVLIRDELSQVPTDDYTSAPVSEVLEGLNYPQGVADQQITALNPDQLGEILATNLSRSEIDNVIEQQIIRPRVIESWHLFESIGQLDEVQQQVEERRQQILEEENLESVSLNLTFYSWLSWDFIMDPPTSEATTTGLNRALQGSLWIISITAITSLIVGVGAAIYLEEYATDNWLNQLIEINIRNLAAIPSVIYGLLGLAVFGFALAYYTSGNAFGVNVGTENGRTVVSAALTLALLILPIIIVNAQEAIRAVPDSFRQASYGLGATKLQTVFKQVLPAALPGIMTGVILALSRAIGETAPLLVVGASTFLSQDPNGPFSKFTVVPIQIFQWTSRPEAEFKNVAAAAIIVLLGVMLLLNATAIILRNRFSRQGL